jgi:hypothetical protein
MNFYFVPDKDRQRQVSSNRLKKLKIVFRHNKKTKPFWVYYFFRNII